LVRDGVAGPPEATVVVATGAAPRGAAAGLSADPMAGERRPALMRVAVSRGDRVTVLGFSDRIERLVRVRSGPRAIASAYRALYDVEARLTEPAYDLAVRRSA
jgi:hypothetical protein